jgi:hypothetical protein
MEKRWLWFATAVIIAAGLYPPWTERANIPYRLHFERSIGYSFLWSPPSSSVANEYPGMTSVGVDGQRLFIEWFVIGIAAAAGMLASRRRQGRPALTGSAGTFSTPASSVETSAQQKRKIDGAPNGEN